MSGPSGAEAGGTGGEFAAIARISLALGTPPESEVWAGDDTAVLRGMGGPLLFAADAVVAGVHADLSLVDLADMGWKAVAVNVSDVAAMGGRPRAAVVTVSGPPDTDLDRLYEGIVEASRTYGCPVVGGDLAGGPTIVVTVAILGDGAGSPPPVLRSGARPGDTVFVTGPLGASAAGLRLLRRGAAVDRAFPPDAVAAHRRPQPRVAEGRAARTAGATAMIDISDGLLADLGHLLRASGVGAELQAVPVAEAATLEEALNGGEDYELCFTAAEGAGVIEEFAAAGLRTPLVIGRCDDRPGLRRDGQMLAAHGWEHRWG